MRTGKKRLTGYTYSSNISVVDKTKSMKTNITLDPNNYLRLTLIVPAIALLGLTSCSTADSPVRHNTAAYLEIAPPAYNSESPGFDRPWPFGPESTQQ
jgi:hypothetical protein